MKTQKTILLSFLFLLLLPLCADAQKRVLKAYLFPYLPKQGTYYKNLEVEFEKANPDIDLTIILDSNSYYNQGLLKAEADVYEIDCIFLDDMVAQQRIDAFPDQNYLAGKDTVNFDGVYSVGGSLYAIPHWICSYFMIYNRNDAALRNATYLADIERTIGKNRGALMMSLGDNLSAGEAYIDGLRDDHKEKSEIATILNDTTTLDNTMIEDLGRLLDMIKKDGTTPETDVGRFISGDARAYVTYAETMCSLIDAIGADSHISKNDIMIRDWPLSDKGSRPLGWVDGLAIKKGLDETKKADARKLIDFMLSDDAYYLALKPQGNETPRYLLPPYKKYYRDEQILKNAPLYSVLANLVENFGPLKLPKVTNREILNLGNKVMIELKVPVFNSIRKGHFGL